MKTAIVTGVTGQDGSFLAESLLNKGYRVIGAKRRSSVFNTERIDNIYNHKNFIIEFFDLTDPVAVNHIIAKYKPDEFYNIGAQSHVRVSFDIPAYTISTIVDGVLYILEGIRQFSPHTKLYQASSSEMFGDNKNSPFNENSELSPVSPYGVAKSAAHNLVKIYRSSYNLHASCGILFNHESERRGLTFVTRKISNTVAKIKLGLADSLTLGNIYSYRDWGYAKEYVEAMWMMVQQDVPDDYVIATNTSNTVEYFLKKTFEVAGIENYQDYVKIDSIYNRPYEVDFLQGNYDKAKKILNWEPKVDIDNLIEIMYSSDLKQLKNK